MEQSTSKKFNNRQYYCQFELQEDTWVCTKCGRRVDASGSVPATAFCKGAKAEPSLIHKVVHYAAAVATHAATGFQKRSDEDVNIILQICQACPHYSKSGAYCTKCGCRCNANKSALTNKIRMRSQSCPVGRW